MESKYSRNRIYVSSLEQEAIQNTPVLIAGCGIGSVIAECALRLGFENITIVDGDQVELSNLNRQNYIEIDIATNKADAIAKRLLSINPKATIKTHNCFIDSNNMNDLIHGHKIAINALDFTSKIPLQFDEICQKNNIPVLHPYNLGWGALIMVIDPKNLPLSFISKSDENFNELNVVEYATGYMKFWGQPKKWIEDAIEEYKKEKNKIPPPQLSVASWLLASNVTHLLFKIATGKMYKIFPEFYLTGID